MKHPAVNRLIFRAAMVLVGCLLLAPAWAPVASADPTCASGNLSGLMGTTCDIGSLQFFFIAYSNQAVSSSSTPKPSDFTFAPVTNGFSLSFDGGPQSVTSPSDGFEWDFFNLIYSVTDLDGDLLGESVAGGSLASTGNGGFGNASYTGETEQTLGPPYVEGYNEVVDGTDFSLQNFINGAPFSVGDSGIASPFFLYADDGGTASWDGTPTTFTYDITPEPSSVLLFGTGLLGIVSITRRKLAP